MAKMREPHGFRPGRTGGGYDDGWHPLAWRRCISPPMSIHMPQSTIFARRPQSKGRRRRLMGGGIPPNTCCGPVCQLTVRATPRPISGCWCYSALKIAPIHVVLSPYDVHLQSVGDGTCATWWRDLRSRHWSSESGKAYVLYCTVVLGGEYRSQDGTMLQPTCIPTQSCRTLLD